MKKTIKSQNGKVVVIDSVVLTDPQANKLQNPDFANKVKAMLKDMHMEHNVEVLGNVVLSNASRIHTIADDTNMHELEMAHLAFLSWVDKELPEHKEEPSADEKETKEQIKFCKALLANMQKDQFDAKFTITEEFPWVEIVVDEIPAPLMAKMLALFIKTFDDEQDS